MRLISPFGGGKDGFLNKPIFNTKKKALPVASYWLQVKELNLDKDKKRYRILDRRAIIPVWWLFLPC